ncbi:hypothetical protein T11_10190 [Trichinella zimbabwensis]|uniref:Uncharacterized protein n=1 Tax=Trichinella zimbabwensis TaxID=268475 RepID=A0A0V1HPS3_9BILA|nr:hypothetical protein T11_10190 [Trichinella zimbabwensis]
MFYPMKTCMRPVEVVKELRKPVIIIPDDFLLMSKIDEVQKLLKLMLNHRSDQRLSSAALLNSELLPISEMEPVELHYNLNKSECGVVVFDDFFLNRPMQLKNTYNASSFGFRHFKMHSLFIIRSDKQCTTQFFGPLLVILQTDAAMHSKRAYSRCQ